MPASNFDQSAAALANILIHSLVTVDATVLSELQGEEFLLVNQVQRTPVSQRLEEYDAAGKLVLDVHFGFKLLYAVSARVLEFSGLADYFPGRALDDMTLACLNARRAFQFQESTGKLVYTAPRQVLGAGDLPTVEFTIENLFVELDLVEYPSSGGSISYVELPDFAAAEVADALRTALLADVFEGTAAFGSGVLQCALFDGNPASGGTELMCIDPESGDWYDLAPGATPDVTIARNSSELRWSTTSGSSRSCTHVRLRRNGLVIRDFALPSTLTIPAGYGVLAPAGALALQLSWPIAETGYSWAYGTAAWLMLQYTLGGARTAFIDSELRVAVTDADPGLGGATLDEFDTTSGAARFTVSGVTATFDNLSGTNLAPAGGWAVGWVRVAMSNILFMSQSHSASIAAGDPVTLNTAPVLTLP